MARITISDELENELNIVKDGSWKLKYDRGLESTVKHILNDYKIRRGVEGQIITLKRELTKSIEEHVSQGVKQALKEWILGILSFGKP